ncbi:ejaculatory bulb-specific protein 3 [Anabrus simplex]|uniref:ejaculatory bulb-specific protein 3 n=1 Tax=Anabrus simplex TaxID=316456 RepID=UPI0034DDB351
MFGKVRCVVLLVVAALAAVAWGEEHYTDKYDKINIDQILTNDRLLNNYRKCLTQGYDDDCSQEGKALKKVLSEALVTDCKLCTEKQKANAEKVIKHLLKNKPEIWQEISARYDPHGEYFKLHPDLKP